MDVSMPVCDGLRAARAMREMTPVEDQPVIIGLTGRATEATRVVAIGAGMDECLFEPVDAEQLRRVVRRWVGLR